MIPDEQILTCREFTEIYKLKLPKGAFMGFARSTGYFARAKGVQVEQKRFVNHINNFGEEIYTRHNAYPLWIWRESFLRYAPRKVSDTDEQCSKLMNYAAARCEVSK
jgi:hypothetical protein